jgi:hypothetical protein
VKARRFGLACATAVKLTLLLVKVFGKALRLAAVATGQPWYLKENSKSYQASALVV